MAHKRVYLYLLLALLVFGVIGTGYFIWQERRQEVRVPQGTLVDTGGYTDQWIESEEKEVMQ